MDDKQQEFQSWLADKLQAKDMDDLKQKVQQMGDDGVRKAYDQFLSEKQQVQSNALGGKLDYIKCLQAFKKGGMLEMKKCNCGGKMEDGGMLSKKGYDRKDAMVKEKNPGKKDYLSKDKKKIQTAVGGVKEYQAGGQMMAMNYKPLPTSPTNTPAQITTPIAGESPNYTKTNNPDVYMGRYGVPINRADWQKTLAISGESKDANSNIRSTGQTHFQTFEDFANYYGSQKPQGDQNAMIQKQLMQNQQNQMLMSDKARGLDNNYNGPRSAPHADIPMIKPSAGYHATGGTITSMKYGERKDGNTKKWTPKGERNDGGKKEHSAVGGNKSLGKMVNKGNGERKDVDTKEKNPGKKDWMDKGDTKQWKTAVTKVPKGQQGAKLQGGQPQQGK